MAKHTKIDPNRQTRDGSVITGEHLVFLLVIAAMAVFVYASVTYDFTQDDAYISFRYAANFLNGHGLVYNAMERVEGYTNFLWVILMALFKGLFGIDFLNSTRFLGVLAGSFTFYLIYILLRTLQERLLWPVYLAVAGMLLSNLSLPYWAIASLETSAFSCLALAALVSEYRRPQLTPALLVIATLLRPEGVVVFGVILLERTLRERKLPMMFALMYIVPLVPFAIFKLMYYGSLFPNPYYAKSGVGLEYIASGLEYAWYFLKTVGVYGVIITVPLAAVFAVKEHWKRYRLLYLYVIVYSAYVIWVGGDVLKVYRFFVPVVPVLYFLFVMAATELLSLVRIRQQAQSLALLVVALFSVGSYLLSREHVNTYWYNEQQITGKMHFMGTMLKKYMGKDFSIAASTIGMIGYELHGHRVIDMLGLTDAQIARNPEQISGITSTWKEQRFNSRYLLEQQPDFVLFSTGYKPSAPAERALMLHSEFRRCYRTVGFLRDNTHKIVWQRYKNVEMAADQVLPDMEFVNRLSEGYYQQSHSNLQGALDAFLDANRRLGGNFPVLDYAIGHCQLALNRTDSARAYFDKAIAADSLCWEAHFKLALMALRDKDTIAFNRYQDFLMSRIPWLFDGSYVPPRRERSAAPVGTD